MVYEYRVAAPASAQDTTFTQTVSTYWIKQLNTAMLMNRDMYYNGRNQQGRDNVYRTYLDRMIEVDRAKLDYWKMYYTRMVDRFRQTKDLAFATDMLNNLNNIIRPWQRGYVQFLPNMHVLKDLIGFQDVEVPTLTRFDYGVSKELLKRRHQAYKNRFFDYALPPVLNGLQDTIADLDRQGVRYLDNPYALLSAAAALVLDIAPNSGPKYARLGRRGSGIADDVAPGRRSNKPNRSRVDTPEGVPCVSEQGGSIFAANEWVVASTSLIINDLGWLEARVICQWGKMTQEQIARNVERGKAPKQVKRFDIDRPQDPAQVHFNDRNGRTALRKDGTWKHKPSDGFFLERATKEWLREIGWKIPPGY